MNKISFNNNLIKKIKNFFFPFYKTEEISKIFDILYKNHSQDEKIAMFVGGCVRNFILDEKIDDIDIATVFTPTEIKEKFKNTDIKVIDTGVEHGSVTLILNQSKFEITTLRKDIKTDGRHAEISFTDNWKDDSERRDFTINAIYLDRKGNFFDPQLGVEDLKNNTVKFIGDPSKRIEEDYLRIIRFIRFALKYSHKNFEPSTIQALKLNLSGIKNISKERILQELIKIISLKNFRDILNKKELKDIFSQIFPEFKNLIRLNKVTFLPKEEFEKLNTNMLLALMLIDEKNNHEYFAHKYNVSNNIKDQLNLFSKNFKHFKENKNFFNKDLEKNIYLNDKNHIINLNILNFITNTKLKYKDFSETLSKILNSKIHSFPYDGKYLKENGMEQGSLIGQALNEIEEEWILNNFKISNERVKEIIRSYSN